MRDLKLYWKEIRDLQKTLPEFVWLTSVDAQGGPVVEAPAERAAVLLHAKSHRVATVEEIGQHRAEEEAAKRRVRQDELRGRGVAIVAVPEGRRDLKKTGRREPKGETAGGRVRKPGAASGR